MENKNCMIFALRSNGGLSAGLEAGMYFLQVSTATESAVLPLIKR